MSSKKESLFFCLVWHKVRSMESQVRIKLINNGLIAIISFEVFWLNKALINLGTRPKYEVA